jgi:hypothetical protein
MNGAIMARWSGQLPDEQAGEMLRWYEGLETQVMDFICLVPPHDTHNLNSWSSQMATVLVEACCLIESIFHQFKNEAATVQGKPQPRARLTLGAYAELDSSRLCLPERTVILLTDTPTYRTPFALWTDPMGGACFDKHKHVPEWWDLYNRSKHRRITAFPEFTLTRAIDALARALVVISTIPAFAPALLRHEWLPLGGWNPEMLLESYLNVLSRGKKAHSAVILQ